ncbi:MAG: Ig-like domain-containing protein, partial [Paramuribaculum sp.]|nr:Ig-like domain-containing protein [Paramuribaculum sp.]
VTAVKPCMSIITATSKNGLIASCVVTVVEKTIEVTELTLNYEEVEIIEGISLQLTATVEPHDATDRTLIWRTSNPTIVTVSTNGLIKAVNPGKANITVTAANGLKAICEVTVVKKTIAVTALTLNVEEAEIVEASVLQLTATIEPRDATDRTVTWTSSDESVAVVNTSGLVTAVTPGIATITATAANGLSASCAVTVTTKSTGIYSIDSEGCKVRIEGGNIIAPEGSEVFDLTGRRVKPSGLHVGIYLIRTPDGKTVKIRL